MEFVEEAWQRHLRLAMLLTGDPARAEELLQDSLVKLYERWRRMRSPEEAHAYLPEFTIAVWSQKVKWDCVF